MAAEAAAAAAAVAASWTTSATATSAALSFGAPTTMKARMKTRSDVCGVAETIGQSTK